MRVWMKWLLVTLAVVVIPLVLQHRYANRYFERFNAAHWEQTMIDNAYMVEHLVKADLEPAVLRRTLARYAHDTRNRMRIRLIDPDGRILYDSGGYNDADVREDKEVLYAIENRRYKARFGLNPIRDRMYYYSALPILSDSGELMGVAHVIRHTKEITDAMVEVDEHQTSGAWVYGTIAGSLALVLSWAITRRLRRLEKATRSYAATGQADVANSLPTRGSDEVASLARSVSSMIEQLDEKQRYNQHFILTTLHELKSPITAIKSSAEILQQSDLPGDDRERFAANIGYQGERLSRLVGELHELTSIDLQSGSQEWVTRPIGPFVVECVELLADPASGVAVDGGNWGALVRFVPHRLEQVLGNLLDNALRLSPKSGTVQVVVQGRADGVAVFVVDQGGGIREDDFEKMWETFFTTVPKGGPLEQGHGLGLSIVKQIVMQHGGDVFARNIEGGAEIGFILPVAG